jgi:3-isopropylmalate/(R)-2-methylmalate dehydratase small subunit
MQPFKTLEAIACPLALENVDTDQLIPARFMSRPRASGYGGYLLHDVRAAHDAFVLDEPRYAGAKIIVARRNFGTGSSREAAVYALWDYGIRCVVAPSFGDIFASNAVKNGLLPAQVSEAECHRLLAWLQAAETPTLHVDLDAKRLTYADGAIAFTLDPVRRLQLLNGWDDLDLTLQHTPAIAAYRARLAADRRWALAHRD